jgi:hypothetical protein
MGFIATFVLSCLMIFSCKLSTGELAKQVQESMIETWQENGIDLKITKDLLLVKKSNTEYSGLVTLSAEGETEQATVNVIYDGESFSWEIGTGQSVQAPSATTSKTAAAGDLIENENPASDFKYDLNEAGDGVVISSYIGNSSGKVVIPAYIEGYPVVSLENWDVVRPMFFSSYEHKFNGYIEGNADYITSIVIPDTVKNLEGLICQGLEYLEEVRLPKNLTSIKGTFFNNVKLSKFEIPTSVTEIADYKLAKNNFNIKTRKQIMDINPKALDY